MFCFGVGFTRNIKTPTPDKRINQEHEDANSKIKHSTRNIKTPTPNKTFNQEYEDANSKQNIQLGI
jgi:hypothetical protein